VHSDATPVALGSRKQAVGFGPRVTSSITSYPVAAPPSLASESSPLFRGIMPPMSDTKEALARARKAKSDTQAVAALSELMAVRQAIKTNTETEAEPLQAQFDELDQKLSRLWATASATQAEVDAEIRRLGAIVAGQKPRPTHVMPREKPVPEARILRFFEGTNVLFRPVDIAQSLGIESTPAFRKMLRAMAEMGAIDQYGERGGSKYCSKGAGL
jgi:hypothetical protein